MPKPVLKKINLNKLISRSINLHKLSEAKIKFNLSKKNSSIEIDGDEGQLNRVFINLIKNSIESINEKKIKNADFKGKINVDIEEDSDYIFVTTVDNGIGFDQVDKKKMLVPYFTTKKNRNFRNFMFPNFRNFVTVQTLFQNLPNFIVCQ